jgi:hypothetical protein
VAGFNVLAIRSYGDSPGDTYLYPGLGEQGGRAFAEEPADGGNIKMLRTFDVSVHGAGRTFRRMAAASPRDVPIRIPANTAVYVSDCRVVLSCENWEKVSIIGPVVLGLLGVGGAPAGALIGAAATAVSAGRAVRAAQVTEDRRAAQVAQDRSQGARHTAVARRKKKVMVGQIRYEWIKRIGASSPKRPRIVALEYTDSETTKSLHLHLLRRGVEPAVLAQDIARRAAAFRLRHSLSLAPDQKATLEQLIYADILHPTPKQWAYYDLPASQLAIG